MILLWGLPGDRPLAAVRVALARRGAKVVMIDQRAALRARAELHMDSELRGWIETDGLRIDLAGVRGVYVRPYDPLSIAELRDRPADSEGARRASDVHDLLRAFAELTPARVVNRCGAMSTASSKPHQLLLLRNAGFDVPVTLCTTDPDAVRRFAERHGTLVYKSLSSVRSVVRRMSGTDFDRIDHIRCCPTQFQAFVPGHDVRVHVVGNTIFACRIESEGDDYRYASARLEPFTLDAAVAERCRQLAARLDLAVAGIDLRETPDGRWVCFELNPSPAFTYYDRSGEIAEHVAELLYNS